MMSSKRYTEVNTFFSDVWLHLTPVSNISAPWFIRCCRFPMSFFFIKKTNRINKSLQNQLRLLSAALYVCWGKAGTAPSLIRHITKAPTKGLMQPRGIVLPRMTRAHKTISIIPPHNTFSRHLLKIPHHHRYADARLPVCILSLSVIPWTSKYTDMPRLSRLWPRGRHFLYGPHLTVVVIKMSCALSWTVSLSKTWWAQSSEKHMISKTCIKMLSLRSSLRSHRWNLPRPSCQHPTLGFTFQSASFKLWRKSRKQQLLLAAL